MKKRTVALVTGGAGFIGSHTADALQKSGYEVVILDNLAPPVHRGIWPSYVRGRGFRLVRGDVRRRSDWLKALRGVSCVFHLAAYQDQRPEFSKFFETNTVSTALLYELIVQKKFPVKKVIVASTQFVYGDGKYECPHTKRYFYPELRTLAQLEGKHFDIFCAHGARAKFFPFREDQPVTPTNSYGLSKKSLEDLAFRLGKTYGIPTVALRYSIVQGERQSPRNLYSGAIRIFVTQALREKPITVYEDGVQLRDFVNVHDVVRANLLALRSPKANFGTFNVGGGRAYRVLDFARLVKRATGSSSPIVTSGFRRTDTRHAVSDISRMKKLGWQPRFGPERSVADYVLWYRGEHGSL